MYLRNLTKPNILWGTGVLLLLSLPFAFSNLDLSLSAFFYHQGWGQGDQLPWTLLYRYGTLPGLLIASMALILFLGSWLQPALQRWRRPAAVIIVTLLLGPGLLINVLGKGYWGRPRPRDVTQFQGSECFQRFVQPGTPGQGKSFPCGHASVGYLLVVFYFLDPNRKRRWWWLGTGLGYGTLMGVARIAQGGHFASDVLWAGGLTYLSAALTHHVILPLHWGQHPAKPLRPVLRWLIGVGTILSITALAAFFLVATPYSKEWDGRYNATQPITTVRILYPAKTETIQIIPRRQTSSLEAHARLQGFGFPKLHLQGTWLVEQNGTTLNARLELHFDRWVTERKGQVVFYVQDGLKIIGSTKTSVPPMQPSK